MAKWFASRNRFTRGTLVVAAVLGVVTALPGTANASTVYPISGSTYSSADAWYRSSNYRTMSESMYVGLQFDSRPLLSDGATPDQIKWIFVGNQDENLGGPGVVYYIFDGYWHDTAYIGIAAQFRNQFARYTTCNNCNHNFSGHEEY